MHLISLLISYITNLQSGNLCFIDGVEPSGCFVKFPFCVDILIYMVVVGISLSVFELRASCHPFRLFNDFICLLKGSPHFDYFNVIA